MNMYNTTIFMEVKFNKIDLYKISRLKQIIKEMDNSESAIIYEIIDLFIFLFIINKKLFNIILKRRFIFL